MCLWLQAQKVCAFSPGPQRFRVCCWGPRLVFLKPPGATPSDAEPSATPALSGAHTARPSLWLCPLHPTQPQHFLKPGSTVVPSL